MRNLNQTLTEVFKHYKEAGLNFAFIVQGGNQGDQMIYAGAEKLAELLGINHTTHYCFAPPNKPNIPQFDEQTAIYMHGGGGFNRWWAWSPVLVRMLRERNPNNFIIVGPSTFDLDRELLDKIPVDKNMVYLAREKTTYEFIKDTLPHVHLSQDTSLYLTLGDGYLSTILSFRPSTETHKLLAVRGDVEKANIPTSLNIDKYEVRVDPCIHHDWAGLHLDASVIATNRCHSAILGSLLKKKTILFAGSYHKNKSIWEYSLKERGVEWLD